MKRYTLVDALVSLYPDCAWHSKNGTYDGIVWDESNKKNMPTLKELMDEIDRLQAEYNAGYYLTLRKREYPPLIDYLDGVVKNDEAQIQDFKDRWNAVDAKYPPGSIAETR